MATTPAGLSEFAKAIDPGVRKHYNEAAALDKSKLDVVFKVENQVDFTEEHQDYSSLSVMPVVTPGETYSEDAPIQAYNTTYTLVKRGITIPIQEELMLFNKDKEIFNMARQRGESVKFTIEKQGSSVYNNSFSTSYTSYGDAKPLVSTLHPRADGGTAQSNASSTGITLTEPNLETAILAMVEVKDHRGELRDYYPTILIVPPALAKEALIITKSDQRSGIADNDANVYGMSEYMGGRLKVVTWKYIGAAGGGSDTQWFLLDGNNHMVKWLWGTKPELDDNVNIGWKNDLLTYKAKYRASTGWDNWRGVWGSKGDGQAYAS